MLTAQAADSVFESDTAGLKLSDSEMDAFLSDDGEFDFGAIDQITADLSQAVEVVVEAQQNWCLTTFTISSRTQLSRKKRLVERARFPAHVSILMTNHHTSLHRIDKTDRCLVHTHKGFEITSF